MAANNWQWKTTSTVTTSPNVVSLQSWLLLLSSVGDQVHLIAIVAEHMSLQQNVFQMDSIPSHQYLMS